MAIFEDEARLPPKPQHVLGESLDALSAPELGERIALCQIEIGRLEAAIRAREATKAAADAFFQGAKTGQ